MGKPTRRTKYDWTLEILSFLALLWTFVPLLFQASLQDVQIPLHYNWLGRVDRWGDYTDILFFPRLALIFYITLSILEWCYKLFNFPCKVTAENANTLYRLGVLMIRSLKLTLMLMFAYSSNTSLASIGKGIEHNEYIVCGLVTLLFTILIVYIVKMFRVK